MYACPFEVPHFEWEQRFALIVKCDLCVARLKAGAQQPACSATCPTQAIQFGTYEAMLDLAHQRLQTEPQRYINHVFGENENGGTSTFYISPVPFEQLGFPAAISTKSPAEFNRKVTEIGTPVLAGSVALGMTGIYLALEHKEKKQAESKPEATKEE
jgi:formate dehydrogenase iron-sulfur subunit